MTSRFQLVIILLLTAAMLVIFISPAVPSAPRSLRARHAVTPLHLTAFVPLLPPTRTMTWQSVREALVIAHSPDVVDLTSARLC